MTDREPSKEALRAAREVEVVFTDRLHIKAHYHYTDTARNIATALDAFAQQARDAALDDGIAKLNELWDLAAAAYDPEAQRTLQTARDELHALKSKPAAGDRG